MTSKNLIEFLFILFVATCITSANVLPQNHLRIVGGQNATITDYPYQISLQIANQHVCGGSIINENYILTAAHCTYGEYTSDFSIRVNSSYRNEGGQVYRVSIVFIHPNYDPNTFDYDISILKLRSPLTLGVGARAIQIASAGTQITDGLEAIATGWGQLGEHSPESYQLQVVTLPLLTTQSCAEYYPTGFVTDRMICAGYDEGGKDTCTGDSGGPLVVSGIQIGLTSWGTVCAAPRQPGAFTNLPYFKAYIDAIVNSN